MIAAVVLVAIASAAAVPAALAQPRDCESLSPNERQLVGCPPESGTAADCSALDYAARIAARCPDTIGSPDQPGPAQTEAPTTAAPETVAGSPTVTGLADPDDDRTDANAVPTDGQADGGGGLSVPLVAVDPRRDPSALPVLAAVAAMATVGGAGWLAARRQRAVGR